MKDDHNWIAPILEYAHRLEGQQDLSPNEQRIIALAREVEKLRLELRRAQAGKK